MIPLQQIEKSKHILIECDYNSFSQASILYSLVLTMHKKISLFSQEYDEKYAFLPWYEKLRTQRPASADLIIDARVDLLQLYSFLKENNIKINPKMATAFYAGLLEEYDFFLSSDCDGTFFAVLSELIDLGAAHKVCVESLVQKVPLRIVRMKSIVYKKLLLKENAELAYVAVCDEDFAQSGAVWEDIFAIAKELLNIVHIRRVEVVKNDEKDKIIKLFKEV